MKRLRSVGRNCRLVLSMAAGWLALSGTALAQFPQKQQAPPESGSYVLSYFLVLLSVGLALVVVCRSSHRRDRARPEQYEESKVKITE